MPRKDADGRLWLLVARIEREAVEEWRKEHVPHADQETALAVHLASVRTVVERTPGGNVSVICDVQGRLEGKEHQVYFSLQRAANRLFKVVDPV